jgi:glycosyltransferase involved in cell wall biosynthesis
MVPHPADDSRAMVVLFSPVLTAVSGVSTHVNMLFASDLARSFDLMHFQVGSERRRENSVQKLFRFMLSPFYLALFILRYKPAIIHLNTSLDRKAYWRDAAYLIVAKLLGRKVVYQIHGGELPNAFFGAHGVQRPFARWLLRLPDAVILLAEVERNAYEGFSRFKRLLVIPNAIDLNLHGVSERKSFDSESLRLGYIGRLVESKGILEAIESLHILRQRGFDHLNFTIAGSGPAEAVCRQRVRALDLEDQVSFIGPVFGEAKIRFWRDVDIFVFPTYHPEGLPYTVLESLASGTPMVTTRAGGIPDAVADGVHGFLIEPHNPEMIADSLQRMLSDRDSLRQMSAACVQRAKEHYSVDRLARQFSNLYKAVLK